MAGARWTEEDDAYLSFHWGTTNPKAIAKALGRTHSAIFQRARTIGLGPANRGTMSIRAFAEYSGFSPWKIRHALQMLGRNVRHVWRTTPGGGAKSRITDVDLDLQEELLDLLLNHPTGRLYEDRPGAGKSTQGKWGVGRKPEACVICGTPDNPHYAKGKCTKCYDRLRAEKRKKTDVGT